jgi:hypothetical protein
MNRLLVKSAKFELQALVAEARDRAATRGSDAPPAEPDVVFDA